MPHSENELTTPLLGVGGSLYNFRVTCGRDTSTSVNPIPIECIPLEPGDVVRRIYWVLLSIMQLRSLFILHSYQFIHRLTIIKSLLL